MNMQFNLINVLFRFFILMIVSSSTHIYLYYICHSWLFIWILFMINSNAIDTLLLLCNVMVSYFSWLLSQLSLSKFTLLCLALVKVLLPANGIYLIIQTKTKRKIGINVYNKRLTLYVYLENHGQQCIYNERTPRWKNLHRPLF